MHFECCGVFEAKIKLNFTPKPLIFISLSDTRPARIMPKGRWKKRKQRDDTPEQHSDQPAKKKQKTGDWKEWVKENPRYEEYYKVSNLQ